MDSSRSFIILCKFFGIYLGDGWVSVCEGREGDSHCEIVASSFSFRLLPVHQPERDSLVLGDGDQFLAGCQGGKWCFNGQHTVLSDNSNQCQHVNSVNL